MIIDTDVLIWDLRGNTAARTTIAANLPFTISTVTYIELLQGMRNKQELKALQRQLRRWSVTILQITPDISGRAMFYVEEYCLSHTMQLADALIAASAVEQNETLLTANSRHYRHLPELVLAEFRPDRAGE